jgi:hypothetical protein
MIRRVLGFGTARRVPEMVGQLASERALDDRFLKASDRRVELLVGNRALADELVENLRRNRRERRLRGLPFRFAAHSYSSCYAPHTKFRTPSPNIELLTSNPERRTPNVEPRTSNPERRTSNVEHEHNMNLNMNTNAEARTRNRERS